MKKTDLLDSNPIILSKLPGYFLWAVILLLIWLMYQVFEPFLMVLVFAAIIATVTFPIYTKIQNWVKGRRNLAALLTCLVVVFVIVIPITIFILILVGQAMDLYKVVSSYIQNFNFSMLAKWQAGNFFYDLAGPYSQVIAKLVQDNIESLKNGIAESAKFISSFAAQQSANILTGVGVSLFNFFLMFFSLYFFYRDGELLMKKIKLLIPIRPQYEDEIFERFRQVSNATVFGGFLTAVAQGIVGWIGFEIAGVPSSFFWGTAVAITSLIPNIGTALVWFPMGVIMIFAGNYIWGIFLLIWGVAVVSTVDNFLRVIFIGSSADLNPLLAFISIFGGLLAFGIVGVILGPMILIILMTLLRVYELEYKDMLTEEILEPDDESIIIEGQLK